MIAGSKWGSSGSTLNATYKAYVNIFYNMTVTHW
jgi:hypothetical protein